MVRSALKIAFPLDGAIVLPRRLFELDANPVADLEGGGAHEADDSRAAVVEFDLLPDCVGGGAHDWEHAGDSRHLDFFILRSVRVICCYVPFDCIQGAGVLRCFKVSHA